MKLGENLFLPFLVFGANDRCVTLVRGLGAPFLLMSCLRSVVVGPRPQKSFLMTGTRLIGFMRNRFSCKK